MSDSTLIAARYGRKEHLFYPEMVRVIDQVMQHPDEKIEIPDNFLNEKYIARNLLLLLIRKIKLMVVYLWIQMQSALSNTYKIKFKAAVIKIIDAYDQKIKEIYRLACKSINEQDKIPVYEEEKRILQAEIEKKKNALPQIRQKVADDKKLLIQLTRNFKMPLLWYSAYSKRDEAELRMERIQQIDPFFDFNDIQTSIATFQEEIIRQYSQEIKAMERMVKALDSKIEEAKEENARILTELHTLTAMEDFIPFIDPEEDRLLGKASVFETEETESQQPIQRSEAYLSMISDFETATHCRDLAVLWGQLLDNFKDLDDQIESWQCAGNGSFSLKLRGPLRVWLHSDDPKGGCIFLLGDNKDHEIKGTLKDTLKDFSASFDKGFNCFCIYPIWGEVTAKMGGIFYKGPLHIDMPGTYMGHTKTRTFSFSTLKNTWKNQAEVVTGDYHAFMRMKFNEA